MSHKTYLSKVETTEHGLSIIFPEELLNELNLLEGEHLQWEFVDDDSKVIVTKVKFIDNTKNNKE